jgi:hypothetical protein
MGLPRPDKSGLAMTLLSCRCEADEASPLLSLRGAKAPKQSRAGDDIVLVAYYQKHSTDG